MKDIDPSSPDALIQYHDGLAQICSKCEEVLTDYEQILSPDKLITVNQAKDLLANSPIIAYLMALSSLVPRESIYYQSVLDGLQVAPRHAGDLVRFLNGEGK